MACIAKGGQVGLRHVVLVAFSVALLFHLASTSTLTTKISSSELGKILHNEERTVPLVRVARAPSRRGEHIINNNVRKVYRNIVDAFLSRISSRSVEDLKPLLMETAVLRAVEKPLPQEIDNIIQTLVVHVSGPYSNENSDTYGRKINELQGAVVNHMLSCYQAIQGSGQYLNPAARNARNVIQEFVAGEFYIDETALNMWRPTEKQKKDYEEAKRGVKVMFENLEDMACSGLVTSWVRELYDVLF